MRTWQTEYAIRRDDIFQTCIDRMHAGSDEYRDKDVLASKENLMRRKVKQEMAEEYYDIINYAVMRIIQLQEQA